MTDLVSHAIAGELPAVRGRAFYLALQPDPVFAVLHLPEGATRAGGVGVLLCAPFGWDELSAHRSLRVLSMELAQAGFPALRFDLPATGDSGGSPRDGQLLDAWTAAVDGAARWLRSVAACERIVAIGIGLGGMLACRAIALGAPIDDLVLWSVPAQGTLLVREMRAFARLADAEVNRARVTKAQASAGVDAADGDVDADGDDLNVVGFILTPETVAALESLDLTQLELPDPSRRRVMLLGRDTLAADRRMREHFERSGVALTVSDGGGYGTMMVDPYLSQIPRALFARVLAWLQESEAPAGLLDDPASAPPVASEGIELTVGEAVVRETPLEFEFDGGRLAGVLTEPVSLDEAELCVVLLNAGAVRRIGTQRMWVELARRWAARGVPTLRFDVVGVGDSDGEEELYARRGAFQRREVANQVLAAFDELERRGLPGAFHVIGICSGAYWGLHAALADERVRGMSLLNLLAFFWSPELGALRDARRTRVLLAERELGTVLRIVATDRWRITRMARTKLRRVRSIRRRNESQTRFDEQVIQTLDLMRARGLQVQLLLSLEEPLFDDFVANGLIDRLDEWPNLQLERIPTNEHIFRPLWCQRYVHEFLDGAIERTLSHRAARSTSD